MTDEQLDQIAKEAFAKAMQDDDPERRNDISAAAVARRALYNAGYTRGHADGQNLGFEEGLDAGCESQVK